MQNEFGSSDYQSDEQSSAPPMGPDGYPNGATPVARRIQQDTLQRGWDEVDVPSKGAGYVAPVQMRTAVPASLDEAAQNVSEESIGESPVAVSAVETSMEAAELNEEIGNPEAQEAAEEAFLEATPEQLRAASAEESAEEAGEEGLFDTLSSLASGLFETADTREVGSALSDGQEAAGHEEFFPLLAALVPTLLSSIGPSVAKQVVKALTPHARQAIKRIARSAPRPGGMLKRGTNILTMFSKLLESAQEKPGGESGAEIGEELGAMVAETASAIEVIIGTDDRVRVANTVNDPWRRICLLRITFPNGQVFRGTGFFIGARTLVTAGHCVYLQSQGGWARKIEVSPGANGTARPYGTAVSTTFRSVRGWVSGTKPECDYGCIVMPAGAFNGRNLGKFGFAAFEGEQLLAKPAVLSGYPGDKPSEMWGMRRRIKTVTAKTLIYEIDTVGGQSGAPVYIKLNGKRFVVGIHNYGNSAGNSATRVTPAVYQRMKNWSTL